MAHDTYENFKFDLEKEMEETEAAILQYGEILGALRVRRYELIAMKQELESDDCLNSSLRVLYRTKG